jgi:hypothetical protein
MNEKMTIRILAVLAVLQSGLIFGTAIGIVATVLGATPAVAAVAAATITVASAGVGLTVAAMLLSAASAKESQGSPLAIRTMPGQVAGCHGGYRSPGDRSRAGDG